MTESAFVYVQLPRWGSHPSDEGTMTVTAASIFPEGRCPYIYSPFFMRVGKKLEQNYSGQSYLGP